MSEWICSDSDCSQYCRKESDLIYCFVEIRDVGTEYNRFLICPSVVALNSYSIADLRAYCASYYPSLEEMVCSCGMEEALRMMAECVFEQLPLSEMEFTEAFTDYPAAEKRVQELVSQWSKKQPDFNDFSCSFSAD